ncbi:hypothetical protein MML48_9g00004633 [Holotrichia oblita]|uniref:Uncharacterized protein n=1 Tax=Holotrichia oblita TaxID=644536 RepID=A0ACB9SLR7_HOLOL|nr:hypothetical protein MML48_9g00004633 [Holotrichia oblita]
MYEERKHITLHTLKDQLKTKEIVSLSTKFLVTLLKDIGFKFRKDDNRRALVERHYVALMRSVFLKKYVDNLVSSTPRPVVFLDETWIYSKGNKSWQNDSVKSVRKPEGYDGKRFIILHAGTENGFISGASLIFASNNKVADYHASMNSTKFEQWVTTQLLPNIPEKSLILMDNAPYHSVVLNKLPTMVSRKQTIMDWLHENNVNFSTDLTKYQFGKEK